MVYSNNTINQDQPKERLRPINTSINFENVFSFNKLIPSKKQLALEIKQELSNTYLETAKYVYQNRSLYEKINLWLLKRLKEDRYYHAKGTEECARKIAQIVKIDPDKAGLAAILHDNAKVYSEEKLLRLTNEKNLKVLEQYKNNPEKLHGPVGAYVSLVRLGVLDREIINAIWHHSKYRPEGTLLEKVIFLADKIDPYKRDEEIFDKAIYTLLETNDIDKTIQIVLNK